MLCPINIGSFGPKPNSCAAAKATNISSIILPGGAKKLLRPERRAAD